MNIILLGPQGSGKGTQAGLLVQKYGLNWFEGGKILRSIARSDNERAREIKVMMKRGELIPDEFMRLIAWDFINKNDQNKGYLFDGYPRGVSQYEALVDMLKRFGKGIDRVIYLNISEDESVRRLSGRVVCAKCGEIYNLNTEDKPREDMKCSKCGSTLERRDDDLPEAVKRRLELYHQRTGPILERAGKDGILLEVDGERPIETVFEDIVEQLK